MNKFFLSFFISIVLIVSCHPPRSEWEGSVEEVNGVLVVKNPKEPIYKGDVFRIDEELAIGKAEGEEEHMFNRVRGVDVDRDGNMYVLDSQSIQIRVFDKNGQFLRMFGRQGQGPGEMEMPIFIQIISKEEIVIYCSHTRRMLFFSPYGDYLRQISSAKIRFVFYPIRLTSNGNVFARILPPPTMGGTELKEFDSNLELLKIIYKDKTDDSHLRDKIRVMKPWLSCNASCEDTLVWGFSDKYELNVSDSKSNLIKKINKDFKPLKVTEKDLEDLKDKFSRSSTSRLGRKPIYPDFFPAFHDISVDEDGRVFVGTYEKVGKNGRFYFYDVFDSEGLYIAKVPIRARSTAGFIWRRNKLYTVETGEEGFDVVKRYNITWDIKE